MTNSDVEAAEALLPEYLQPDTLITPQNKQAGGEAPNSTGNGLKYLGLYLLAKWMRGAFVYYDLTWFLSAVGGCMVASFEGAKTEQLLLHRGPTKREEQIAKDDVITVCTVSKVFITAIGPRIMATMAAVRMGPFRWFHKNLRPAEMRWFKVDFKTPNLRWYERILHMDTWRAWYGKNPEVVAHIQWCGLPPGKRPNWLRRAWQAAYLCLVSVKRADLVSMNVQMVIVTRGKCAMLDRAGARWLRRMREAWPNGMRQALAVEFEAGHPVVLMWPPEDITYPGGPRGARGTAPDPQGL